MIRATPSMRNLAKHLVAYEVGEGELPQSNPAPVFRSFEKLRPHLSTLMGSAGVRALLERAIALAPTAAPWLGTARLTPDGALQVPNGLDAPADKEMTEGEVVLLAQLLELLVVFIGQSLTLRILRQVWPGMPAKDFEFRRAERNEKATK